MVPSFNRFVQELVDKTHAGHRESLETLTGRFYTVLRDHDFASQDLVSHMIATPLPQNEHYRNRETRLLTVHDAMHVITSIVSDTVFEGARLDLGGEPYGEPICVGSSTYTPLLRTTNGQSWPVIVTEYHEICITNVPRDAQIWVCGFRLKKEALSLLQPTQIPNVCKFQTGMVTPVTHTDESIPRLLPF